MHTFLKQAHIQFLCKVAHCTGHVLQASCVMTGTNSVINFLLIKAAAAYSTLSRNDGVSLPIYIAIGHIATHITPNVHFFYFLESLSRTFMTVCWQLASS